MAVCQDDGVMFESSGIDWQHPLGVELHGCKAGSHASAFGNGLAFGMAGVSEEIAVYGVGGVEVREIEGRWASVFSLPGTSP